MYGQQIGSLIRGWVADATKRGRCVAFGHGEGLAIAVELTRTPDGYPRLKPSG